MSGKRVLLINPPLSGKERYGKLAAAGVYMPPLGLGFLASALRQEGFEVGILDYEALGLNIKQAAEHILSFQPDYVGITAVTMSIFSAAEVAAAIKQYNDKIYLILGGIHLGALPEETLNLFPQFDIGVIGEGEITIIELLKALSNNVDLQKVTGIIYRDNGSLIKTAQRPVIKNLDILPFPAWDLYPELKRYYRPSAFGFQRLPCTSLITSRGCPGRCSFCDRGVGGQRYREHSAEYVMEMVRILYHKYGIRDLAIYDGTFGVNRSRLLKLCEMLIKEGLDLVWSCNFRVEMAELDTLRLMKAAGCWGVAYGIESCSQRILDFLQKDIDPGTIAQALRWTKKAGIVSKGYIMVGAPMETEQSFKETLTSILRFDLDLLTVNSFTPFPGTLDYQRAHKYGKFNKDWKLLNQRNFVFVPEGLSQKQIGYFTQLITRKFYLRPRILWKYLKMSLNSCYFKLLFNGLISFIKFAIYRPIKNY
ncbi:MAG: cobalamin-dependent protein [Candidatus Omnitrophica bacterium]|nr:cobalamin-dependent protein [Candidatus Omnitrophota bacterium]